MDYFEDLLHDLNSHSDVPVKCRVIIRRLSLYFTERKSDSSVDLLLFLTFGENGITSFIRKVVTNEVSHPNVLSSFQLLEFILVNFEKECIPYVDEVMKLCLSIAQMNVHARVRENSLKLLNCMFAPSYLANLDLSGVLGTICVLKESDPPPSVLMRLFTVIGIILERAPEVSHQYKDEFLGSFVEKIKDVESSNKCETLLSGCFDGVYGYLVHFTAEETVISDIYSSLKKNCRAEVNQKRLVTDRAALKVIIRHHRVFAKYIFEDINSWRETLNYYLKKSGEDRQLGYRGLVSVYRGVACALDEEGVGDREKLNNITEALLECPFDTTVMIGLVELISTGQVRQDLTRRGLQMIMEKSDRKGSIYLSTNLECVSKYLTKPGAIVGDHLAFLRKTAVTLIGDYPNMDSYFRLSALQALERSFYYLGICGRAELDEYAKEVIYQGLIRSCSHQIYQDVELQKDITGQDMISHKSYLPLWLHLTNLSSSNTEMEPFDGKSMVSAKIFDEYLSSVLKIIKKLDLGIRVTNPNITDLELAAEANRPTDFRIFINVVNLFVDVMEELEDGLMMKKWLAMLFTEMTHHSSKKPLISGFYKILAACLKLADKLDFFASCEKMLQRFLRDISFKVGRYKGDLQISCFQVLLAAPVQLIEPFVKDLVPVFKVIVQVGSGHFPLLKDCLTALEKWHSGLPKDSMEYLLRNTLPCFDVFLQTKGRMLGDVKEFKSKPLRVGGRVRKLAARETESQLLILQRRFLLFLGKLDQDLLRQLIQPIDEEEEDQDYGKELSYAIPLSDIKLRIKMKELLPRIVELSLSSSDRRTRVTACEFLHSIVLLTLGSMKQMNGELNELFGRLVSVCLVLSCDSDHVIFQIFEPLTTQMAHYFSSRERDLSETGIFVNCLMEAASHPHNSSLRDLAARLVREFADWSLRRREVGSPDNIMTVLQKMYSFSVHPDHNKRCGAATVFNNIYTIIREQTDLIDTHWFLLYYHFMECLSMCSSYDDTTHITTAINLIKASLTKKNFSSPPKVPTGFKSDMTCLMEWIFSRCSHPQMKIRGISMEMVEGMSKGSSVKQFVKDHIKDVKMKPRKSDGDDSWLRYTAKLFHYYGWLLHHDVINESHMLAVLRDNETDVLLDKMANFSGSVRASVIIQMLEFVIICIKKGIIWQKNKILLIVKDCLYSPSMLELEDRESLYSILENLFQLLSPSMNNEEIKIFSSVDSSIFSHLQQRLKLREPLTEQMELLKGLEIMYKLNFWNLWKFGDTIRGDELLQLVFDSLFADRRRRCVAVAIDPNEKVFLCDLIRFSLKIGVSSMALWQLLAKGDAITEEDTFQQNTKGGYFTQFFKPELTDYFIETFEPSLRVLIKYHPTKVQETVNEALKHSCRSNVDGNVKEKFIAKLYQEWSDVERMPKENKRVCLLSIVKGMCELDPSRLLRESSVLDWVHDVMTSSDLRKDVEVFAEVLPYLSAVNEEHNQKLTLGLESLYKNLDVKDDFDPALAVLYKGLIKSFARSKSLPVLREITRIVDLHNRLLKENEVNDVFCETSPDQLRKLAHFLYDELFNRNKVTCESFLRTLLLECDSEFTREFLLDRFGDLMLRLGEADVDKRIRALGIVQICVPRFSKENLEDLPAEKKEIFRSLMMSCVKTLSGSSEDRRFSCACFNTLCAVIAARTNDPRQYKSLIFKEDFPYLSKLVDRERVWSLRMDFDKLPKMRKVFASLRRTITRERQMRLGQTLNSVKYLHEETLFSSSLREDVTKFDYTYVTVRPMKFEEDFGIELEMDALNDHECMATLVGVVEHLVEEKVTPKDDPDTPFWLKAFIQRLKSWNSHENEKIFLMKLMCNLDRYLKPYADEVAPVLLNAVLEVFHQKPINYLVIDVITMVLNWKTDYVGLEAIATRLAIVVINKSDSYRKDIVKSNLELAKLIVESFRDNLNSQLLSTSAFEALGTVESDPNVKYLHLQFSGILLVNGIPAWIDGKEEEFFKMVLVHCSGKSGKIAAEVAGAALQYLEKQGFEGLDTLVQMTREKVRFAFTCGDAFGMNVLYAIHKIYPKISSDFLNVLRNSVWVLSGSFKTHGMEMLLSHLKRQKNLQNDPFLSVIDSFIVDMLTPDDLEILALSLQMLVVGLEKSFCWEKMRPAVEKALTFSGCRNLDVRKGLYDLAEYVYSKGEDEELRLHCKMVLLDGMNDSDSGLSERCLKFWRDKTRAPNSAEQFSQILCESYHPNAESGFLSSVARLIISSPATSAEYIFDHPLAPNCSFQKTTILKTAQRSTIAPMFAQTLSSQLHQPGVLQSLSSAPAQSILHSLLFSEEVKQEGVPAETTAVKKRRFLKDAENAQAYYAKKQMVKKEAELEEQREMTRKLDNHVDIFKEYSSGDIPDIRISHSQFLKPLEALTRDPQIARHFLTALYDSLSEEMTESAARLFCIKIGGLIQHVAEAETPNPTVVGFLFHVLLHCEGRLEVDADCVARLAKSSGWLSVGGLLLEEMLIRAEGEDEFQPRKGETPEEKKWLQLADICRSLKEFEVLRGIFLDKLRVVDEAAEAIHSESVTDWQKAAFYYQSVLKKPQYTTKNDFYAEACFNSLARLSDWSAVNTGIHGRHEVDQLWTDTALYENILPWLLKSEMVLSLQSGNTDALLGLIDCEKESELKKLFPEEFAIAHFTKNNFQWVKYYVYQMFLNFLSTWSYWNKWSNNLRSSKLVQLQLITELDQCAEILSCDAEEAISRLVQTWSTNKPRPTDDLLNWDMKLNVRSRFLVILQAKYPTLDTTEIRRSAVLSEFEMVRSGIAQRNVKLSGVYLDRIGERISGEDDLRLLYTYYKSSLEILREGMTTDVDVRVRKLADACCSLERHLSEEMVVDGNENAFFESCMLLNKVMASIRSDAVDASRESLRYAESQLGAPISEKQLQYLEKATRIRTDRELSEAFLELMKYHRRSGNNKELAKCLLRSMQLGNPEARHLFCCLLNKQLNEWMCDDEIKEFCSAVPVWMFLKWTNQILANVDSIMFPFVKDILIRLTEEYPNAIRFAFRLSKENYKYSHVYGQQCRLLVHRLDSLLSDAVHENFLTALSYVAPPSLVLQYDLNKILVELRRPTTNWASVIEDMKEVRERLFGQENAFRGSAFDCLMPFRQQLDKLLKRRDISVWQEKISAILKSLQRSANPTTLKEYSPYLTSLKNTTIELPGQYSGDQKPILNYHVTISSFKYNVLVMNSKCQPIRVTILGNDAKDYKFLIKFGEDLRQDQRIQQVFGHMNHVLRTNQESSRLSIDTYGVVPLKNNLGMIEWVSRTTSLFELLTRKSGVRETIERVQQEHLEFLSQGRTTTKVIAAHINGYLKIGCDRAVARFRERVNCFEWDLLRKAFWGLSSYPEQFVYLRHNFAVSQAVIYVAHWLVGIGDRHLDNTLVSSRTGRALGIDFGCAFGFATEFLTPPELIPFRLTPQIVNLMKPLGESGLIKETMIQCLRALRRDHDALVATLQVFALEPALDWLEKARRDRKMKNPELEKWCPERKVAIVQEKLSGSNPLNVFVDDLISGHTNSDCLEKYLEVLQGVSNPSQVQPLSEQDQVQCLINLATDYHVLSKTYVGWNPWL